MRSYSILLLCLILVFPTSGCQRLDSYTSENYTLFDTHSLLTIYHTTKDTSDMVSADLWAYLQQLHQLFDIYHSYEGITNLYDINEAAGGKALSVDPVLFDFLVWCKEAHQITDGKVNVMFGAVTSLWHQARTLSLSDPTSAYVPAAKDLSAAFLHTDINMLELNKTACTVRITDPEASLDVGALAKGYAARLGVQFLQDRGIENFLLNLGGNVCAFGKPDADRDYFVIGIQDPDGNGYYASPHVKDACVVTSGDYQRYYEIDHVRYHHIIDPNTLFPATYHRTVSIIHHDSALADLLSTALFLLPEAEGLALAKQYGAEVIF